MAYKVTVWVSRKGVWEHLAVVPTTYPEAWEVLDEVLAEDIDFEKLGALPGQSVLIELHPGHVQGDRGCRTGNVLSVRQAAKSTT